HGLALGARLLKQSGERGVGGFGAGRLQELNRLIELFGEQELPRLAEAAGDAGAPLLRRIFALGVIEKLADAGSVRKFELIGLQGFNRLVELAAIDRSLRFAQITAADLFDLSRFEPLPQRFFESQQALFAGKLLQGL